MIGRVPKRPTLQDVADAAGLSSATVSYALRGERGSEETVRRVRETAARLGYEGNSIAAALASGRTKTVAVLCGSLRDVWQQALAADLSRALMAAGRHAIVADADGDAERERELLAKLRAQRPDGLVVAPLDPFAAHWRSVAGDLPVVAVGDRLSATPDAGAVVFDNAQGFSLVFDHLQEQQHRRIAVVLPRRPSTPDRPAERLVAEEAERRGVSATVVTVPPATADPRTMTEALAAVLRGRWRPTAVFCLSDSLAFGMLRAARARGLHVPRDLSVVGYENVEFSDLAGPGLTTVDWVRESAVDAAVSQLLGASERGASLETRVITPRLVVRGTTSPPPG